MAPSATHDSSTSSSKPITKVQFETYSNIIDGKLTSTSKTRHAINPSNKKSNGEVPIATEKDVDVAVKAGKAAFKKWSKVSYEDRRKAILAFADALAAQKDEFAKLLTTEQGKPLQFADMETTMSTQWMQAIANLDMPEQIMEESEDKKIITRYTPLGVVVAIVPWNFPILLACGKIAPALITGNVIIIKPSPFTPYCGLKLGELAQQFFPPGVVQVLSGDDNLGPWLTAHAGVDKISFTGSTATGKKVMESASKTLKRVTLELGGNDPAIICKSADVQKMAPAVATMAFLNSGQICLALKRIYIHEAIYDEFRDAMVAHTKTLSVGDGFEDGVFLGPIQNSMQYDRVRTFFDDIEKEGYKVAVGGKVDTSSNGYFINPTIIDNPAEDSRIVVEEPFGPILPIMKWSDEEDVIERANNTDMGLGASVWSGDLEEAERIGRQLDAGSIWINTHFELDPTVPFGGHKSSGLGSEWGVSGLKQFCNSQSLFLKTKL